MGMLRHMAPQRVSTGERILTQAACSTALSQPVGKRETEGTAGSPKFGLAQAGEAGGRQGPQGFPDSSKTSEDERCSAAGVRSLL